MHSFAEIRARAADRKGGEAALDALLADETYSAPARDLSQISDDRILSEFSKRVFQAGFNWSVIEKKWPGFETAFHKFDLGRNAFMSDEDLDTHLRNTAIVRHAKKILSVRDNAIMLQEMAAEKGSAGQFLQDWPSDDLVGLWRVLKKRGNRLGGTTGQYALRFLGKDCFILSKAVVTALVQARVVEGNSVTSKSAQAAVQKAFNDWQAESGQSLTLISRL